MAASIQKVLGPSLVDKQGNVASTADALAGVEYIGVYFSAHWCPPCRGFTPRLSAWFTENGKKLKTQMIFASSDRSEKDFKVYFDEMSWDLALPFGSPVIEEMSSKYKVSGIPTLLIFDAATGEMVTADGRKGVITDPSGAAFPWKPRSPIEILTSAKGSLVDAKGNEIKDVKGFIQGLDYVALYFSAHWCPPCRGFTPDLAAWYSAHIGPDGAVKAAAAAGGRSIKADLIFISSDRDAASYNEYLSEMPWKALSFDDRTTKTELSEALGVEGIPMLVVLEVKNSSVVTTNGRSKVENDPEAFPWGPKAVESLEDSVDTINEIPTAVLFTDKLTSSENEKSIVSAFEGVADSYFSNGKHTANIRFAVAADGDGAVDQVRSFLNYLKDKDGPAAVRLDIIDIARQRKASLPITGASMPGKEEIAAFVKSVLDGSCAFKKLKE